MTTFSKESDKLETLKNNCFKNIMWNKRVLAYAQECDIDKHKAAITYNEKRIKRIDEMKNDLIVKERNKQYIESIQAGIKRYFLGF